MIDVVVSVYKENIYWLKHRNYYNERIYAYKKFERFDYDYIELLPNIGRESHTFIHHFLKHYNFLNSDYLMLLQGNPYPHLTRGKDVPSYLIFKNEIKPEHNYYHLGDIALCNSFGRPFSGWDCELYRIWDALFGSQMPVQFIATYGAQQIVHKDLITMRSRKFWEKAYELHYEYDYTAWAFELLWYYIFNPNYKSLI